MMTTNPLPPGERVPGTVGLPAGVELAVLNPSDKPVPAGTVGEVCVRGENVTRGCVAGRESPAWPRGMAS